MRFFQWVYIVLVDITASVSLAAIAVAAFTPVGPDQKNQIVSSVILVAFVGLRVLRKRFRFWPAARTKVDGLGPMPTNGHEFEHWCANHLRRHGWQAEVTQESGDQGIDIVASRGPIKVGVQCKRYSSPVGNKAVQEAYAGKAYHGLDVAAVVASSGFTRSAHALAANTGVILILPGQLPDLGALVDAEN